MLSDVYLLWLDVVVLQYLLVHFTVSTQQTVVPINLFSYRPIERYMVGGKEGRKEGRKEGSKEGKKEYHHSSQNTLNLKSVGAIIANEDYS